MGIYKFLDKKDSSDFDRIIKSDIKQVDYKNTSAKEKFDFYIKESFINGNKPYMPGFTADSNEKNFGFYIKRYNRYYDRYFSESLQFEQKLSFRIQHAYNGGKGNEFKNGKFYSVASSSRFATSCFSENKDGELFLLDKIKINNQIENCSISLEKELDVFSIDNKLISNPQIDVVVNLKSGDVYFIEVKCHEILDNHKPIKLKYKYKKTKFIKSFLTSCKLSEKSETNEKYLGIDDRFLEPRDFDCDLTTFHFDFKQFLCHLMGILQYQQKNDVKIHFYYLLYKNEEFIANENSKVYDELEKELYQVFSLFQERYKDIDFGYFYNDSFNTLDCIQNEYKG